MSVHIRYLQTLRAVQEHGSVNAAAQALYLSPSAVSQQLQTLSSACGFPVIERSGRGVRLTDGGSEVAEIGEDILVRWESAVTSIRMRNREASDGLVVRLGAFPSAFKTWLLPVLTRMRARTGVRLELFETSPREVHDLVLTERLDAGIVVNLGSAGLAELSYYQVRQEPFVLAVPVSLAFSVAEFSPQVLSHLPWVLPGPNTFCDEFVIGVCARLGFRPRAVGRSNDWQLVQELAATLQAVALVPASSLMPMEGMMAVTLDVLEPPMWNIELTTRLAVSTAPWFTSLRQEILSASGHSRSRGVS